MSLRFITLHQKGYGRNARTSTCKSLIHGLKLTTSEKEIYMQSHTLNTYMDLVLVYNQLAKKSNYTIVQKWVLGHAGKKKKDKPLSITSIRRENIEYGKEANAIIEKCVLSMKFKP